VDRGEAVEAAALRETEEECGIKTRIKNLLGIYSYSGRAVVVAVYVTEYVTGNPAAGDEALEVKQFRLEDIPWDELAFPSTADALKDYCHLRDVSV
jgi:ADP-ribose pyrophosphatase YjhB (NUDIX family)